MAAGYLAASEMRRRTGAVFRVRSEGGRAGCSLSARAAAANVALALTTKLVAAGYLAASAAAAAFCAIPSTWVLIAVVGALVGLCAYMASASKHTAVLSDEMGKLREKGDDLRATDQLRMERLQQLAEKENLNNAEIAELHVINRVNRK